ncbi:MAG: amidohydrolase, partial [Ponticaulis sp.]|nr:amidohydrolase [Ponticaulis sp.]
MIHKSRLILAALGAIALAACGGEDSPSADSGERFAIDPNPFPSTYERYPSAPTLITGARVLDGLGG